MPEDVFTRIRVLDQRLARLRQERGRLAARARQDDRVCLLHNPERIIPRSLNLALAAARGRWLVRVDAHASVPPEYVGRAVQHLRSGQWSGVGGRSAEA